MDKEGIKAKHEQLVRDGDIDTIMNPIVKSGDTFIVYGIFKVKREEVKELAELLNSML